jgi:two-component system, sensor histidine kinase and response regulator
MNDHVAKPIDPDILFETVGRSYRPADAVAAGAELPRAGTGAPGLGDLSIAGLDAKDGLSRAGGNRKLYLKLLREFIEQQGTAADEIARALTAGSIDAAERLAHSLKGVAGNLGATRVQSAASTLEKLLRGRAPAKDVDAAREQVAAALAPLTAELQTALNSTSSEPPAPPRPSPPASAAQSREAAAHLTALLSELDPRAADFVEANHAALGPLFGDRAWADFEQLVQRYAFADAQAQLAHAVGSFHAAFKVSR